MRKKDVEGNALVSQLEYQKTLIRGAETIVRLERHLSSWNTEGIDFLGLTIRPPEWEGGDYLVVSRWEHEGNKFVAFCTADSILEVVRVFAAQVANKTLKLKEDKYAK